jgi:hypothetical protein
MNTDRSIHLPPEAQATLLRQAQQHYVPSVELIT